MSYACPALHRQATEVTINIGNPATMLSETEIEESMDTEPDLSQNRSRSHWPRPLMRQAGPNMHIETAFDRSNVPELARLVMLHGEISFRRRNGSVLAIEAAQHGNATALRILLGRGDTPEHTNALGQTLLIIAAVNGHTEAVTALAGYLPDLNRRDHQGNTALIYACMQRNSPMVDALLEMGADLRIRNNANKSAADIALENDDKAILLKLRTAGMRQY